MRKSLCVCLVVLVGLVFFSGCGKVSQRAIIGKWEMTLRIGENVNQIRTLKLSKDGTFTRGILYQSAKESLSRVLPRIV